MGYAARRNVASRESRHPVERIAEARLRRQPLRILFRELIVHLWSRVRGA